VKILFGKEPLGVFTPVRMLTAILNLSRKHFLSFWQRAGSALR
jgi:hypothetical protein